MASGPLICLFVQTPMKCFERAEKKCNVDMLSTVVGSSVWGKTAAIGTGANFQIVWSKRPIQNYTGIDSV